MSSGAPARGPRPGAGPPRLAVTGTDTGVGKTLVGCALVAAWRASGVAVAPMKPVETGVAERHAGTDAERLRRAAAHAGGPLLPPEDVCPAVYAEPLAPLVAAERAGRPVALGALDAARARLEAGAARAAGGAPAALLVEGAGGLLVPIARDPAGGAVVDLATLAARWGLDLVVVAGDRLGVLNHALLTVREAERRGLAVRAVVLNALRPAPADAAEATNLGVLRGLLPRVPVLAFPFVPPAEQGDPARLAECGRALAEALAG